MKRTRWKSNQRLRNEQRQLEEEQRQLRDEDRKREDLHREEHRKREDEQREEQRKREDKLHEAAATRWLRSFTASIFVVVALLLIFYSVYSAPGILSDLSDQIRALIAAIPGARDAGGIPPPPVVVNRSDTNPWLIVSVLTLLTGIVVATSNQLPLELQKRVAQFTIAGVCASILFGIVETIHDWSSPDITVQASTPVTINLHQGNAARPATFQLVEPVIGPFLPGSANRLQSDDALGSGFKAQVCEARASLNALGATSVLVVGGHDMTALSPDTARIFDSNQGLAQQRADEVAKILRDPAQCAGDALSIITAIGGPRVTNTTTGIPIDIAPDRRVEIYAVQ